MTSFQGTSKIKMAVITGQHAFDVPAFHNLLRSMPDVDPYPQELDNFCADVGHVREQYDVLLFYNFHRETPSLENAQGRRRRMVLEEPEKTGQGIFVMHHALLAFPDWPPWSRICGIHERAKFGYYEGQNVRIEVANADHPITRGLAAWEMVDETYTMGDAGADSDVLLTTEHPNSMHTIAWTRQYGSARVFCLESGHDDRAYSDPNFRTVVERGIHWLAGRL
jgi:type 1 glutamine amidotransferase